MSVEFHRESPGKFDSRTLNRETLNRWTWGNGGAPGARRAQLRPFLGPLSEPQGPPPLPYKETLYKQTYIYIYIYTYIHIHTYVCIYIYIYIHIRKPFII